MVLKLYPKDNPPAALERVSRLLNDGGVIIVPTGTTYAIACHALKERAVERICALRDIDPKAHPLSVICYDMSAISEYARISNATYKLLRRNLPGPFTFILPGTRVLPKIFRSRKEGEIGIRMPESPILQTIIADLGAPLMTASLPMTDDDPAYVTDPQLIDDTLGNRVDLVIDGGMGTLGQTTVVSCLDDTPEIIRQGDGELA